MGMAFPMILHGNKVIHDELGEPVTEKLLYALFAAATSSCPFTLLDRELFTHSSLCRSPSSSSTFLDMTPGTSGGVDRGDHSATRHSPPALRDQGLGSGSSPRFSRVLILLSLGSLPARSGREPSPLENRGTSPGQSFVGPDARHPAALEAPATVDRRQGPRDPERCGPSRPRSTAASPPASPSPPRRRRIRSGKPGPRRPPEGPSADRGRDSGS